MSKTINVKLNGKEIAVNVGKRIIDLVDDKTKYCVCKINSQVKELNYMLSEKNDGAEI